ncbi:hypothetical protein BDW72DRAFT_211550 [Aspergillus terricola var. indicus]
MVLCYILSFSSMAIVQLDLVRKCISGKVNSVFSQCYSTLILSLSGSSEAELLFSNICLTLISLSVSTSPFLDLNHLTAVFLFPIAAALLLTLLIYSTSPSTSYHLPLTDSNTANRRLISITLTTPKMPMNWNDQADAKLLGAIIETSSTTMNWKAIAEIMGPDCTAKAVMHRVSRIKEKVKGCFSTSARDGGENDDKHDDLPNSRASSQTTPVKRKRGLAKKNAAAVMTGGADNESVACNSEDPGESPTKKAKGRPKGKGRKAVARSEENADGHCGKEEGIIVDSLRKMEGEATDADFN